MIKVEFMDILQRNLDKHIPNIHCEEFETREYWYAHCLKDMAFLLWLDEDDYWIKNETDLLDKKD